MCGRYVLRTPADALAALFDAEPPQSLSPRFNVAPTQSMPIVRVGGAGRREMAIARWGLVPRWAKEIAIGNRLINARAETVGEKPAFRDAFRKRRCLVPADGFYEWQPRGKSKQPFFIGLADSSPFAIAGLWESWSGGEAPLESFTLLTTSANELVKPIHDRMPVIVPRESWSKWLDTATDSPTLEAMLVPLAAGSMTAWPVGRGVNSPANDGPELIERAES